MVRSPEARCRPPDGVAAYMQELTPSVVAMAVKMLIIMFITSFHVSLLFSGMAVGFLAVNYSDCGEAYCPGVAAVAFLSTL